LAAAVDLRGIKYIDFQSEILVDPAIVDVPVTVGGTAQIIGGYWNFNRVSDGSSFITGTPPSRPIFRVFGSKSVEIHVGSCQYFQLYANAAFADGSSNSYNQIHLHGAVYKVELQGAVGLSWNNENFFYGNRIKKLIIDGTNYGHNHNKFFNATFEGADVDIQFLGSASVNTIYGGRFEGAQASSGITFESGTYSNAVIQTWSGTGNPTNQFEIYTPISDAGEGNVVTTEFGYVFNKTTIFSVGPNSMIVANNADSVAEDPRISPDNGTIDNLGGKEVLKPGLKAISNTSGFRYWALSELIPVELGDVVVWDADFDGNLVRTRVFVLDANQNPLLSEGAGGRYWNQSGTTFDATYGVYTQGADQSKNVANGAVVRSEVKYIRVGFITSGANVAIRHFSANLYTQPLGRGQAENAARQNYCLKSLNGAPTKGYMPLGYTIYDYSGAVMRRVSYQHETQVNGAVASGGTSFTVDNIDTVANGDIVGVLMNNEITYWSVVSGLAGSTFTISAVTADVSDGARIVFNRWA